MEIIESFLTKNPCYKTGDTITVRGLMLHSVGCNRQDAGIFLHNWNNESVSRACVHAFIDGNSGIVYQTLPWNHRGWHGGSRATNDKYIGVKMCEPACIQYKGGAKFVCVDKEQAMEVVARTYQSAVELFAFLCKKFELDPLQEGVVISHKEAGQKGMASKFPDPEHLWDGLESGYTMDGFRRDVALYMDKLEQCDGEESVQEESGENSKSAEMGNNSLDNRIPIRLLSLGGIEFLMKEEGCKLVASKCAGGKWTIGYGHTQDVYEGQTLPDEEAAKELFMKDVVTYANYVSDYISNGTIGFPVNQNQFDALVSFCYSCGPGNLRTLVSGRDAQTVSEKILLYRKAAGRVNEGLIARRQRERELFLKED